MTLSKKFWFNKKVLLTGDTGFKGSWLSLMLNELGAKIYGYSIDIPTEPSLYQMCQVSNITNTDFANITNKIALQTYCSKLNPDIVIHAAAQSLVRDSYDDPIGTFETNVMGTLILLDQIKSMPSVKSVIVVTSDKCYQPSQISQHRFVESDPMGGDDPYSASKAAAEIAAHSMSRLIKASRKASEIASCGIATVRAGNVIGGGDWASNRLIPDVMQAKIRNEIPLIRNPDMVRPWQHVFQPLYGYLLLAEQLYSDSVNFSGSWNFGPKEESEIPVSEVVRKIDDLWAETSGWRSGDQSKTSPHETDYLRLDSTKSIQELRWNDSVIDINYGLALTVDWYKAYSEHNNMLDFSLEQIRGFLSTTSDSQ